MFAYNLKPINKTQEAYGVGGTKLVVMEMDCQIITAELYVGQSCIEMKMARFTQLSVERSRFRNNPLQARDATLRCQFCISVKVVRQ